MGFKSRYVACLPKNYINDCHVINVVYSNTLDKWLWVDPSWNAYVMDSKGNLLSAIGGVQTEIEKSEFVTVNGDANWNHKTPCTSLLLFGLLHDKNLYYLQCSDCSGFNNETYVEGKRRPAYITLSPTGEPYDRRWSTSNESWFWASPYKYRCWRYWMLFLNLLRNNIIIASRYVPAILSPCLADWSQSVSE